MVYAYYTALGSGLSHPGGADGASRPVVGPLALIAGSLLLLLCPLWLPPAGAGQVALAWDPVAVPTLAGYMLYYWHGRAGVPHRLDVGPQTTTTLTDLVDGETYTFAVSAYDTAGEESEASNLVTATSASGPTLVSPPLEAPLPGATVHFAWTAGGTAVEAWALEAGTSVGAQDLDASGPLGRALSTTVRGVPTDGTAIFVRLWSWSAGTWQAQDFQYTAAPTP